MVTQQLKIAVNSLLRKIGYQITRYPPVEPAFFLRDFDDNDKRIFETVSPYTMTSREQVYSLTHAVEYVIRHDIPGDFVECGVWKGGSSLAIALTLLRLGDTSRHLYLYDAFETGWPEPHEVDGTTDGRTPQQIWEELLAQGGTPETLLATRQPVCDLMASTGYPMDKIHVIMGHVEDTIPEQAPDTIALLRLDTDFYESTRHELQHLYPRLSHAGVLIIDDYGAYKGSQMATDEYFEEHKVRVLLHRVDPHGYRVGVKT